MIKYELLFFALLTLTNMLHAETEGVIVLHGLARSSSSMQTMANSLEQAGYIVNNINYDSRHSKIEELSVFVLTQGLQSHKFSSVKKIHFVTHSMGGILVRNYFKHNYDSRLGRVVMLGPPNQGSEVVDFLKNWYIFKKINGPAGSQLGTDSNSLPNKLGPVKFELGVIAGDLSINWINSLLIPGSDDGKVAIEKTKVDGMKEHLVLHTSHPFMVNNNEVINQSINFLKFGKFKK